MKFDEDHNVKEGVRNEEGLDAFLDEGKQHGKARMVKVLDAAEKLHKGYARAADHKATLVFVLTAGTNDAEGLMSGKKKGVEELKRRIIKLASRDDDAHKLRVCFVMVGGSDQAERLKEIDDMKGLNDIVEFSTIDEYAGEDAVGIFRRVING